MDAHLFRLFASATGPILKGAMIGKFQEPAPGILSILFLTANGRRNLILRYGRQKPFCYFSDLRLSSSSYPPAAIMRLRKYLSGKRVASIVAQFCQRKLWLLAGGGNADAPNGNSSWLCLDLVKGPSLHFPDQENIPLEDEPAWPSDVKGALENWREWPVLTPPLRKTLALMDRPDQQALLRDLEGGNGDIFLYYDSSDQIAAVSAWPLPAKLRGNLVERSSPAIIPSLTEAGNHLVGDQFFSSTRESRGASVEKRRRQLLRVLTKLKADEERLQKMAAREADALALKANLWRLDTTRHSDALSLSIDGVNRIVALDPRFDIITNMERLFNAATRGKRGLIIVRSRQEEISRELGELAAETLPGGNAKVRGTGENSLPFAKGGKTRPKNISVFTSSDGYVLLRGKDASGNRALRKIANPHDFWVHVEQGPGAHVVIRRPDPSRPVPEATLMQAGSLAANKSWLANQDQAPVMFAEIRHVKPIRGKGEGMMSIDKIAKTMLVPLDSGLERSLALPASGASQV